MQKKIIFVLALVACFSLSSQSLAETRIATVDVNKVINSSADAAGKKKQLDAKAVAAKKKIDERRASLKAMDDKLKSQNVAEDSKEADEFRAKARDFSRLVKDTEEELKKEYMRTNRELTERVVKAIKAYSEKNNIDLVLDKSEQVRGPVLFGVDAADITENIIKDINS